MGTGITQEKTKKNGTPDRPPAPTEPCHVCHSTIWWWRQAQGPGEWVCGVCHPEPERRAGEMLVKRDTNLQDVSWKNILLQDGVAPGNPQLSMEKRDDEENQRRCGRCHLEPEGGDCIRE